METFSKPNPQEYSTLTLRPQSLLSKCLYSTFLKFLRVSTLMLVLCAEAFLLIQECRPVFYLFPISCFLLFCIFINFLSRPPPVYLLDFSCLKPPNFCRVPFSSFLEHVAALDCFDDESVAFMAKILHTSGQSEHTYLPPTLHYIPPRTQHQDSIEEAQMLLFPVMDDLLSKTQVSPSQIDILVVNCSAFCPSPSLSSVVVNRYAMREDIKSFNISGMGCSAGTLGIDLARNLLKLHRDSYAVILSTEILSNGWYAGKERPKLLINCHFRMGSAAVLLTNKNPPPKSPKYKLFETLRTQRAFDDRSYSSAIREEDAEGFTGVHLSRDLLHVAGETLRANITGIGAAVLPLTEKLRYAAAAARRRWLWRGKLGEARVPDFREAVQHFCLPASGRPVIREIGRGLRLPERETEAAVATLHRFGNLSSAAVWYELAYLEAKERVKVGQRVWQLGMGSGPKCNSVIWECVRPIVGEAEKGPWADTIHLYPIPAMDQRF